MADVTDKKTRSKMMARIGSVNTQPELIVRKALHSRGFRFRLHKHSLPGRPDLVLTKYRAMIFVHGCFWHCHHCHLFKWPATRPEFWRNKLEGNKDRDRRNIDQAISSGWRVAVLWECSIKHKKQADIATAIDALEQWLQSESPFIEIPEQP